MASAGKVEVGFDQEATRLLKKVIEALEKQSPTTFVVNNADDRPVSEHCDDQTLNKVYNVLLRFKAIDRQTAANIVSELQNEGILFRERV